MKMRKKAFGLAILVACTNLTFAQGKFQRTEEQIKAAQKDTLILTTMVDPQVKEAQENHQAPDWEGIRSNVVLKYDGTAADRAVTKARIFYYFGKDWALFSTALVHFTEAYEPKDNLKLMNYNAKYILKYSQSPEDWKKAQGWAKHAMDKDPSNAEFKETYDGLTAKIKN